MTLNKEQLDIMRKAGIRVPDGVRNDEFLTADDEQLLADYLIASLGKEQVMTGKARKIQKLINDLAT